MDINIVLACGEKKVLFVVLLYLLVVVEHHKNPPLFLVWLAVRVPTTGGGAVHRCGADLKRGNTSRRSSLPASSQSHGIKVD